MSVSTTPARKRVALSPVILSAAKDLTAVSSDSPLAPAMRSFAALRTTRGAKRVALIALIAPNAADGLARPGLRRKRVAKIALIAPIPADGPHAVTAFGSPAEKRLAE